MTNFEKEHPRRPKKIYLLLFLFLVGWLAQPFAPTASAADCYDSQLDEWDITFYSRCQQPSACQSSTTGSGVLSGTLPSKTIDQIKASNIDGKLAKMVDLYKYGEAQTKVPWQLLAAIHWREGNMSPGTSIQNGERLHNGKTVDGAQTSIDPKEDVVYSAKHFIELAKSVYDVDVTKQGLSVDEFGNAFLSYNRASLYKKAGVPYSQSPYVMNGLDDSHIAMHWVGGAADPGKSTTGGGLDGNPIGALTIVKYLSAGSGGDQTQATSSNCAPTGSVASLQAKILEYAYHDRNKLPNSGYGYTTKNAAYSAAVDKANSEGRYTGDTCSGGGVDCGGFITTLVIDSGWDPSYNHEGKRAKGAGNTSVQEAWLKENWLTLGRVGSDISADSLQIGDIAIIGNYHVFMYVGSIPDFNSQVVSASQCSRAPMAGPDPIGGPGRGSEYTWYRKKG